MNSKETNISLNAINVRAHEDIEDIIGHPPSWILYWGIVIVGCFLILFYTLTAIIRYPDKLSAPVILTTENPAITVFAENGGTVEILFTENNDSVISGQNILLLDSNTKWEDLQLYKLLISEMMSKDSYTNHNIPNSLNLGTMQDSYTRLIDKLNDYEFHNLDKSNIRNIGQTQDQILYYNKLNKSIEKQTKIFEEELKIVRNKHETIESLYNKGAASKQDAESMKQEYLSNQRTLENMKAEITNNKINVEQLRTQITNRRAESKSKTFELSSSIESLLRQIENEILIWEGEYVIKAPMNGVLSLNKIWSKHQSIKSSDAIFTILPLDDPGPVIARAKMPTEGIGKIRIGTKANLQLGGYPEQEFGLIRCHVTNISLIPVTDTNESSFYLVELSLTDGLTTTYDKTIPMNHEMRGTAELITDDKSILQRIINQSFDILKNG